MAKQSSLRVAPIPTLDHALSGFVSAKITRECGPAGADFQD
jgi:hypothetical protein